MSKNSELFSWTISSTATAENRDPYVQSVKDKFQERSQVGIRKYGTTLDRDDIDFLGWIDHLQEELMDATLYLERLKASYVEEGKRGSKKSLGKQNKTKQKK
jgi:hypothetical protein